MGPGIRAEMRHPAPKTLFSMPGHRPGPRQLRAVSVQMDRHHSRPPTRAQGGAVTGEGEGVGGVKAKQGESKTSLSSPDDG